MVFHQGETESEVKNGILFRGNRLEVRNGIPSGGDRLCGEELNSIRRNHL